VLPLYRVPASGPGARAMTTVAGHLEKADGFLACRVRREPDSLTMKGKR
jgi:hypothetical protein